MDDERGDGTQAVEMIEEEREIRVSSGRSKLVVRICSLSEFQKF